MPGSAATARLAARPDAGLEHAADPQRARRARRSGRAPPALRSSPPTRAGLRHTTSHAPRRDRPPRSAPSEVSGSSRQIGVSEPRRRAGRGRARSSGARGCSRQARPDVVEPRRARRRRSRRSEPLASACRSDVVADVGAQRGERAGGPAGRDLHPQARRARPPAPRRPRPSRSSTSSCRPERGARRARAVGGGARATTASDATGGAELGVEHRQLQRGARHRVAAHRVEVRPEGAARRRSARPRPRQQVVARARTARRR